MTVYASANKVLRIYKMNIPVHIIILTVLDLPIVFGARILGIFPIPVMSHNIYYRALMTELHSRGHEIVIITSHPMYNTSLINYTEIDISNMIPIWKKEVKYNKIKQDAHSLISVITALGNACTEICKVLFEMQELKSLREGTFDLVMTGWHVHPCTYGYAYHFSAPLIGISSFGLIYESHRSIGNPTHPIYSTELFQPYLKHPTFWEKLERLEYYIWNIWWWHLDLVPQQDKIARQYFGKNMPYLEDLKNNVSLVFTAVQTNYYAAVPKVPALIEIGPIHIKEMKPMPKDLQVHLDRAESGAIYLSFGTNVRSDKMSEETIRTFLEVFSQLRDFRIVWKWDGDENLDLPPNVKIGKWFPQSDILAHPKIKAFIYHCGLHSTDEAINFQVPVIGFPFTLDQHLNMKKIMDFQAGIKLDINTVTKDILLKALNAVIFEPKYKRNMKKLSVISRDQPETPMERAVWWTEYVIRHKGAPHMRSMTMDLTWYDYFMLDVVAFLTVTLFLIVWIIHYACNQIVRKLILLFFKIKQKQH
ncbi:hypothetical protein L9F63_001945 [Diploptera punctata]|uniref:UDP-glycosyltransferase n=1 Tax=Diploptera punctata TaxID=6984 RepID=A0AAD8EIH4_DIPPU|nr:hypothetical protein L9F63_001945 [Diploptera punctata]